MLEVLGRLLRSDPPIRGEAWEAALYLADGASTLLAQLFAAITLAPIVLVPLALLVESVARGAASGELDLGRSA